MGFSFASHSAVGFWKVLAVEMTAQKQLKIDVLESSGCEKQLTKKVKTPHGFPLFLLYLIHSGVMFSGFSGLLEVYGSGTAGPGCENEVRKKGKTPHGFPSFLLYLMQV